MSFISLGLSAQELPPDDAQSINVTLVARANSSDGYGLPPASILGIADVKVNNRGDVVFDVDVTLKIMHPNLHYTEWLPESNSLSQ